MKFTGGGIAGLSCLDLTPSKSYVLSVAVSLCHYVTVSLCHYVTVSLFHCVTVLLCHYVTVSLGVQRCH